jgi:hypothetical protein
VCREFTYYSFTYAYTFLLFTFFPFYINFCVVNTVIFLEPRTIDHPLHLDEGFLEELKLGLDLVKGFLEELRLVLILVEGFLEELKLVLVLVKYFGLLVRQLCRYLWQKDKRSHRYRVRSTISNHKLI